MKLFNAILLALTAVTVTANPLDVALDKRHQDQYCPRRTRTVTRWLPRETVTRYGYHRPQTITQTKTETETTTVSSVTTEVTTVTIPTTVEVLGPERTITETSTTTVTKCEPTPPTNPPVDQCLAPSGQIIRNPSFEDSDIVPWSEFSQGFRAVPVTGHSPVDGSQVLQINQITGSGDAGFTISQTMSVCASTVNFSYSVKQDNPNNCWAFGVYVDDVPMSNVQPGIEWQTNSFTVTYTERKQTTVSIIFMCTMLENSGQQFGGEALYLDAITATVLE
ncbi:hypothetical protein BDD12DRAFT_854338 [Trichophaea hybrida]|nr:hypothetical protein BDD12DRAFT_854338 [Trichophaea hybrida]